MSIDKGLIVDFEEKGLSENDDAWVLTGYASVFDNKDLGDDIVVKGAFAESLKARTPLFLFNHKMSDDPPIGTILDAKEDNRGLWFKAELPKDDQFVAGRIAPQLKARSSGRRGLKGVSIGFRAKEVERKGGVRYIKRADLYEISIVNMPMNPEASVDSFKSVGIKAWEDLTTREREAHLKSLGLSDELAKRLITADRDGRQSKGQREAVNGPLPDFATQIRNLAERL